MQRGLAVRGASGASGVIVATGEEVPKVVRGGNAATGGGEEECGR